jgi:hypothetical protein
MAENSDYENSKFESEKSGALTFVVIVVLWPVMLFLYFNLLNTFLPFWLFFILLLVLPFVVGNQLKKWIDRNAPPTP